MDKKILLHFTDDFVKFYKLENKKIHFLKKEPVFIKKDITAQGYLEHIESILYTVQKHLSAVDNANVKIYATGICRKFSVPQQHYIIDNVFIDFGLYFNIVSYDLENFYIQNSVKHFQEKDMIKGISIQEFRNVVVCGSFQHHFNEIRDLVNNIEKFGTKVLCPPTTKVIPEFSDTNFILLEGQKKLKNVRESWKYKIEGMEKINFSDAALICNPGGTIGQGTMFELGFIIAHSKRIIMVDPPKGLSIHFPYEVGINFY
ncbi:hypothetical protein ERK19_05095 [Lactobacillus helsingborgensis]|uniref:hypothetical protein n=1 Tax=Lactobacillus helsingborgensis TaxID=1218494 RepID=UPI0016501144|nr:hypothetical protein [Lactobacillus helsingborgensis]MBC6356726.1 hypothetical protein [Lactobacillus helsingborgensis]